MAEMTRRKPALRAAAMARRGLILSLLSLWSALSLGPTDALALSTAEIVKGNSRAVTAITTERIGGSKSLGAGFVVDENGVVVTNYHVVQGASKIKVHLSTGDVFDVIKVIATDLVRDIAILRIPAFGLAEVRLGNSDSVSVGDPVVAMGSPHGLTGTVTQGIVSSLRLDGEAGYRVIQTDAAASPGNSGGPLLGSDGRVVGVVTFKVSGENLNFAVPINYVRGLMAAPREAGLEALASTSVDSAGRTVDLVLPMRWRAMTGGPSWTIRKDRDYLYLEAVFAPYFEAQGAKKSGVLKRIGTSWVGRVSGSHVCMMKDYFSGTSVPKMCELEEEMDITELTGSRIVGFVESFRPDDPSFDCARCRVRGVRRQIDFVWIPE